MTTAVNRRIAIACAAFVMCVLAVVAIAGPITPPDPPGPTMKTLDEVEPRRAVHSLPPSANANHLISEPGSYYLAESLGYAGKPFIIEITANDVTLDLNGFLLDGFEAGSAGINVSAPTQSLHIMNGSFRGFLGAGLAAGPAVDGLYENLVAHSNLGHGVSVGDCSVVRNVIARNNGVDGIHARANSVIDSCVVGDNGAHGVETSNTCVIRDVNASSNGGDGIRTGGFSLIIECISEFNSGTFLQGTGNGVTAGFQSIIDRVYTVGNGLHGVSTANFATIRNSFSEQNDVDGFNVGGGCVVDSCTASVNGDDGVQFGASARITGNLVMQNAYGLYDSGVGSSGSVIQDNTVRMNTYYGIYLTGTRSLVVRNHADFNGTNYQLTTADHQVGDFVSSLGMVGTVSPFANFRLDGAALTSPPALEPGGDARPVDRDKPKPVR